MELKTVLTCPLGHKCQDVRDGAIQQCSWFTKLAGKNPSTGESVDEHGCAITWLPVLLIENSQQQRGTAAAVESFRNEMVAANENNQRILQITAGVLSSPPQLKTLNGDT
ncbi:hypothetical protein [Undibacterium rugosum]|uniref:hypothetical protein n=1 Tax=Undibacterium rugosum TaxID=2762291 RepID=UPI001B846389|nr:hypothetical protein [Undibacterium rugosum]MBR7777376.1 hypothetical protein [Undibacterium rugosum]